MSKHSRHTSNNGNDYTISGGVYTGYSFTDSDGKESILGFDNKDDVKDYIEERENGDKHFLDL